MTEDSLSVDSMNPTNDPVLALLAEYERSSGYGDPLVKLSSNGADVVVVSDFHMGPGRDADGCYSATENFFADAAFRRFLDFLAAPAATHDTILVVNGDLADFLRVSIVPETEAEFTAWRSLLHELGIEKSVAELRASVSHKERSFGLKTDDWKSVWKLERIMGGHPEFFRGLAGWLAAGRRLIVLKGNHDLEWYWPLVRNQLRLRLAQMIIAEETAKGAGARSVEEVLRQAVLPGLLFVDDAMTVDGILYIEHGHRYDRYTWVLGPPVLSGGTELNIPFGSFLNRYMLNTVELAFPYADNVRPTSDLLPLLIREKFFVAMKMLCCHVPFMLRIIPKGYYRYLFQRVFIFALTILVFAIGIPAVLIFTSVVPLQFFTKEIPAAMKFPGSSIVESMLSIAASYFMSLIIAHFQLAEPSSLATNARAILKANPSYRFVTMGHTHDPDQFRESGAAYYNTGTWIPIIELDTAEVREDKTYTFIRFTHTGSGFHANWVERWNDDGVRCDDLVIRKAKPASPEEDE